jgi:hypothetical protein
MRKLNKKLIYDANDLILEANAKLRMRSKQHLKKIEKKIFVTNKNLTHIYSFLFLNQNNLTIITISQLINKGQFTESFVLMRLVLERSALIIKALVENLGIEEIEKLNGFRSISYLKKFFDIGPVYGLFSCLAHSGGVKPVHFSIFDLYKRHIKETNLEFLLTKLYVKVYLILIAEINFAVIKFLYKDYTKINSHWTLDHNKHWHYKFQSDTISGKFSTLLRYVDDKRIN